MQERRWGDAGNEFSILIIRWVDTILNFDNFLRVIVSFGDKESAGIFNGEQSKKFPAEIQDRAERKLVQIHESTDIGQLRIPAGNRVEALSGNLKGYHSIRINQQWRIIFKWENCNAHQVQITAYH